MIKLSNKFKNNVNSKLIELESSRNQTDYNYLYDLSLDDWILILCNESGMFLTQSKTCYEYLTSNEKPICKNVAYIYYTLLEADFKGIYSLNNIFINLYEDMGLTTSNPMIIDLFDEFIEAFNIGIEQYIECSKLIGTVKNSSNALIKNNVLKASEKIIQNKVGDDTDE